jgi:hypothetical protein
MTNGTWKRRPSESDYNNSANWVANTLPDGLGMGFFGPSSQTSLIVSGDTALGGWTLKATAPHYTFTTNPEAATDLMFNGAGIVINGGGVTLINNRQVDFAVNSTAGKARITNYDHLNFMENSSAGHASIANSGDTLFFDTASAGFVTIANLNDLEFRDTSKAGRAHIVNTSTLLFEGSSSAAKAIINNEANGGAIVFADTSSAGHAQIANSGDLAFRNTSTAGHARISDRGSMEFFDQSSAGSATIAVGLSLHPHSSPGSLDFYGGSSAGHAVIVAYHGTVTFHAQPDGSPASHARLIANPGGVIDFSQDPSASAGSIEGAGTFDLGGNTLAVGYNNLSTTVSGRIIGGNPGFFGLWKVDNGTLTLSHALNPLQDGAYVTGGELKIAAPGACGTGLIRIDGATLAITNAAMPHHVFGNQINVFSGFETVIDLPGLRFVRGATANYSFASDVLRVTSGNVTDILHLLHSAPWVFGAERDAIGGTQVVVVGENFHAAHHSLTNADFLLTA